MHRTLFTIFDDIFQNSKSFKIILLPLSWPKLTIPIDHGPTLMNIDEKKHIL